MNPALLQLIKEKIKCVDSQAKVILYGSFARGSNTEASDIDLLILLEKDKISFEEKKQLTDPLYRLEFETGQIISPLIKSKKEWENKYSITPLYKNIQKEGIEI